MAGIGHNSKRRPTAAEIEEAIRDKIRKDNIRDDTTFMQRMRWEIWLSRLSVRAKLVGLAIWEHADKDGRNAFPSMDRLLVMVGGSRRDLKVAIDEFAEWEHGAVIPGRGKRSNEYRFRLAHEELANYVDDNVVVPLRPCHGTTSRLGGTTEVLQETGTRALSSTTEVPQTGASETVAVPKEPVAVPSPPRSSTTPSISTRASDLEDLEDLGERPPSTSGVFAKVAASIAAGLAVATPAAAVTQPPAPSEQVHSAPAECWQTPQLQQMAAIDVHELRAQKQVWMTASGMLHVAGAFKAELLDTFPDVDLTSGLAASSENAKRQLHRGALYVMPGIIRQFGFLQQDFLTKKARDAARQQSSNRSEGKPALLRGNAPREMPRPREEIT